MRKFKVENHSKGQTIIVTLFQSPYEDENVLYKTGWKIKEVTIAEITMEIQEDDNN
jgi:hypothetical protein